MTHVYIVRREEEIDVFTDYQIAKQWAEIVGSRVEEEGILNAQDILMMKDAYNDK